MDDELKDFMKVIEMANDISKEVTISAPRLVAIGRSIQAQDATIAQLIKSMNAADTLAEGTLALMNAKIDAQAAEIKRLRAEKELTCTWSEEEEGTWSTSCGELWSFNDGDPADNSAVFCHHCGKRILAPPASPAATFCIGA